MFFWLRRWIQSVSATVDTSVLAVGLFVRSAYQADGLSSKLGREREAVEAALREPWSNGQVEGHVSRLKFLKRQMHGRVSFELLRQRVLKAA